MKGHTEKNRVNAEEATVNLDCVKTEPCEVVLDFEQYLYVTQYRVSFEYENIFGEASRNRNSDYYDNVVGFDDNEVVMENVVIKVEDIKEEEENEGISDPGHCNKCNGDYEGYCLKCSSLSHILHNTSNTNPESEISTAPAGIIEIKETSLGKGAFLLKTLPKDVVFGPFERISAIKDTDVHSWKISDNKLVHIKNANWMKDIVCAATASIKNLDIVQIKGNLYFQSNREIMGGEELLVFYDDKEIQKLNDSEECCYTPHKQHKLRRVFACTHCCLGFRLIKCLMEHKGKCPHRLPTGSIKDLELVECHCCKIWLEKQEYQEYHMAYCWDKYHRMRNKYWDQSDISGTEMDEDEMDFDDLPENELDGINPNIEKLILEMLEDHQVNNRDNDKHQYDGCLETFKRRSKIQFHMKEKHTENIVNDDESPQCSSKTKCNKSLDKHIRRKTFINKSYLKNKHIGNESIKGYKCSECSYTTNYKHNFQWHLNTHSGIKPFHYDICKMQSSQNGNLKKHIKNEHMVDGSAKDYKCSECIYQTKNKRFFQNHLSKHRGIKQFQCDICMMKFTQKASLKMHIKNKHIGNESAKDYKCSKCFYQTNDRTHFQRHLNTHSGIKPFQCDICKKKFTEKGNLKQHIRNKHMVDGSVKDYKCAECIYETYYKINFQRHLNTHSGIKPFQCDICNMQFRQKANLKRHIKNKHMVDGSVKDYKCAECIYETNYKTDFQRHLNAHRGIKRFQCDTCKKKFTEKGNLKQHIRNKHMVDGSVKDYKCAECIYETNYKFNFQRHLNTHSGIKPFQCDICKMQFSKKVHLKNHIKNKHMVDGSAKDYKCSECIYQTNNKRDFQIHLNEHMRHETISV